MGRAGEDLGPVVKPGLPIPVLPRMDVVSWGSDGGPDKWGTCPCRKPRVSEEDQK